MDEAQLELKYDLEVLALGADVFEKYDTNRSNMNRTGDWDGEALSVSYKQWLRGEPHGHPLMNMFKWGKSPEGHDYWRGVYDKIMENRKNV